MYLLQIDRVTLEDEEKEIYEDVYTEIKEFETLIDIESYIEKIKNSDKKSITGRDEIRLFIYDATLIKNEILETTNKVNSGVLVFKNPEDFLEKYNDN